MDCEATGNTLTTPGSNVSITGGTDTRWIGCRFDSAQGAGNGITINPTVTGRLSFINCEANLNTGTGWVFLTGSVMDVFLSECISSNNTIAAFSYAAGARVHCDGGNFTVWRTLTPQNSWANSGLGAVAQFVWRGNSVEVIADITPTLAASIVNGTTVLQFPASVTFNDQQFATMQDITNKAAQAQLTINTTGACNFQQAIGAVAVNDRCFVHAFIPADA
jgi:hypothetical protein